MARAPSYSRTTLSGICLPRILTNRRTQLSSGRLKMRKITPLLPSMDHRELNVDLKPSAVPGPIVSLSYLIWADRLLGNNALTIPESTVVRDPCNKNCPIVNSFICWSDIITGQIDASWHAVQKP